MTEDVPWTMECCCGEANCRGVLTCFRRLPRALQWQEMMRRTPVSGTIPAFILNEVPALLAALRRVAPDLSVTFQTALAAQVRLATAFAAAYDPEEPYYLVGGEPTEE